MAEVLAIYEDLVNKADSLDPLPSERTRAFIQEVIEKIDEENPPLHEDLVKARNKLREKYGDEYPEDVPVKDLTLGYSLFKTLLKRELKKEQKNMEPPDDVEMAMGGRKRGRGKKTKKTKKSRRYTRRR